MSVPIALVELDFESDALGREVGAKRAAKIIVGDGELTTGDDLNAFVDNLLDLQRAGIAWLEGDTSESW